MMGSSRLHVGIVSIAAAAVLWSQPPAPPAPAQPPATTPAAAPAQPAAGTLGGVNFDNVSLTAVIDILAQKQKINYILDPRACAKVTISTSCETKPVDV